MADQMADRAEQEPVAGDGGTVPCLEGADAQLPLGALCETPHATLFRSMLGRLGDKWTLLVISVVGERRRRFSELAESIPGISRRMLTVTLRALERDGLVTRTVYAEVPLRVEYEITDLGRSLQQVVLQFGGWVWEHQDRIIAHREEFDAQR